MPAPRKYDDAIIERALEISTPTATTSSCYEYDTADRATNSAGYTGPYVYDALGRQTTVPASDAPDPGKGDLTLGYFDDDLPQRVKQGSTDTTFTLDMAGRRLTRRTTGTDRAVGSSTIVRHYTDGTDNPAWTATTPDGGTPAITRYAESLAGDLGMEVRLISKALCAHRQGGQWPP